MFRIYVSSELELFISELNLVGDQDSCLRQVFFTEEIFDIETVRLLTDCDWEAAGVKLGTRAKIRTLLHKGTLSVEEFPTLEDIELLAGAGKWSTMPGGKKHNVNSA